MGKNPIDKHVGRRVRSLREGRRITERELAALAGLTSRQIEKYETGSERIGAKELLLIASALGVSVTYFFEDVSASTGDVSQPIIADRSFTDEALELMGVFSRVGDPIARSKIIGLARLLASSADLDSADS